MMQRILKRLISPARYLESILWDQWMNVDTAYSEAYNKGPQGIHSDSVPFQPNAHYTIRRAIRLVQPTANDTVIDLGSAKGRTLCHFARLKVKKVIGIELSSELSEIAEKNARKLRGRKSPIEIRNIDAMLADFSEGSIFFMFNPFGEKTLRSVLKKIELSHKKGRKPATIIYVNPQFSKVFDNFPWLQKTQDVTNFTGLRTVIYKTKHEQLSNTI